MADREYVALVFRHILAGAAVKDLREVKGGLVVVLETPARWSALDTALLHVELRGAQLATLGVASTLTVGQEPYTFVRHANGTEEVLTLPDEVTLGPMRMDSGKALSMMKVWNVVRKAILSTSTAPPSIDALHAVRDRAVTAAERLFIEAGFRGRAPFWIRDGDDLTQAIELVNSRFNTQVITSFYFCVYLALGTTTKTPRNLSALVKLVGGPVPGPRPELNMQLLTPMGLDAAKVVADTVAYVRDVLLPWLETHRKA